MRAACPLLLCLGHDCGVRMGRALPSPAVPCGHGRGSRSGGQVLAKWSEVIQMVLPVSQATRRDPARPCLLGKPSQAAGGSPSSVVCAGFRSQFCTGALQERVFRSYSAVVFLDVILVGLQNQCFGAQVSCAGPKGGVPAMERNPAHHRMDALPMRSLLMVHFQVGCRLSLARP